MFITVIGRGHSGTRAMSQILAESGVWMGEPLNSSWDLVPPDSMYEACREFAELLSAHTPLPLVFWDERRTSVEAHAILHATGKRMKAHKKQVDAVAASLILDGYLGSPDYLRACRAD